MSMNGATYSKEAIAIASRHAQQLRDDWQVRLLVETREKHPMAHAVTLALLANLYYEGMHTMLVVAFPGFQRIDPPFLSGFGRITEGGKVVCDYVDRLLVLHRNRTIYDSEDALIGEFRRISDGLKLKDADRKQMFADLARWISRDDRIKPQGQA